MPFQRCLHGAEIVIRVLIVCTGNSCRSQMAEGWLRHFGQGQIEALSAGTHPAFLHPLAVRVMKEAGIDISSQYAKSVDEFTNTQLDYVVTVCDGAREECPVLPGRHTSLHMPFEDPVMFLGPAVERLAMFRETRDQIGEGMKALAHSILHRHPPPDSENPKTSNPGAG